MKIKEDKVLNNYCNSDIALMVAYQLNREEGVEGKEKKDVKACSSMKDKGS